MYTDRELGYDLYLAHHGIKGMHWGGVRRYQNPNGSLTEKGRKRYVKGFVTRDGQQYVQLTKKGTKVANDQLKFVEEQASKLSERAHNENDLYRDTANKMREGLKDFKKHVESGKNPDDWFKSKFGKTSQLNYEKLKSVSRVEVAKALGPKVFNMPCSELILASYHKHNWEGNFGDLIANRMADYEHSRS